MITTQKLKEYGADVENALARCANNEALYLRLVQMATNEVLSSELDKALAENDLDESFSICHKLKGAVSNMGLTPILKPLSELTELLRHKTPGDYTSLYNEMMAQTNKLVDLLK